MLTESNLRQFSNAVARLHAAMADIGVTAPVEIFLTTRQDWEIVCGSIDQIVRDSGQIHVHQFADGNNSFFGIRFKFIGKPDA